MHAPTKYGSDINNDRYPVSAWVWGHRLRSGQHWMEYLLEFLNVLAGFNYKLDLGVDAQGQFHRYRLFSRLNLRRFVFYDDHEKTRHHLDDKARAELIEALESQTFRGGNKSEALAKARALLRSLSAVEDERSWYAKSLLPVHHNLLFWQADKETPKANGNKATVTFTKRNFFARGGEIYYLILSAGTRSDDALRARISESLRSLLNENNHAIGTIARLIDEAHGDQSEDDELRHSELGIGWIPDADCALYTGIAEDLDRFLCCNLDPIEKLFLLAHLIGLHLVQYIYHRGHPNSQNGIHAHKGGCMPACQPVLLVDATEGESAEIQRASASLFREQEYQQEQKCRSYIRECVKSASRSLLAGGDLTKVWEDLCQACRGHLNLSKDINKKLLDDQRFKSLRKRCDSTGPRPSQEEIVSEFSAALSDQLLDDVRKNFLGVHRKLTKRIGFVAPRTGPGGRFVLGDNLLKCLVLANVPPEQDMNFGDFLECLYERYGIVVGPGEAQLSGLLQKQRINVEYYDANRLALLKKMKNAGLLVEYSDATALVRNPETPSRT